MCKPKPKYKAIEDYYLNRSERLDILEDLEIRHNAFMSALENFKGKGDQDIKRDELNDFPIGKWIVVSVSPEVKFKRRKSLDNILMFDTLMEKGGEFGMHYHSDCEEFTEVVSGEITDLQNNTRYKEGDIVHYKKGEKHIPVATKDTVLRVFFK